MKVNIGRYPKDHTKQRKVDVRIDDYDVWSADHTLALIIVPLLQRVKEQKQGVPCSMKAFDQGHYDWHNDKEKAQSQLDEASKQWDEILDKMLYAFQSCIDEPNFWIESPEIDLDNSVENEDGTKSVNWLKQGKYDKEAALAHGAKVQEGLMLFGKHYQDLWA